MLRRMLCSRGEASRFVSLAPITVSIRTPVLSDRAGRNSYNLFLAEDPGAGVVTLKEADDHHQPVFTMRIRQRPASRKAGSHP